MSRPTLQAFLATARNALRAPPAQRPKPLTFVVGNESADLDSLCCAIVYAYIRSHTGHHALHIPLSNLPRADLGLRPEMAAVLQHAGLAARDLVTLSELPDPLQPEDTRWLLVDHNCLTGPLKRFRDQVVGCVDHHVDEGALPAGIEPRVIEPCGSCMSLVVDECRPAWTQLLQAQDLEAAPARGAAAADLLPPGEQDRLVKLALAPILLDTVNLTAEAKVRPKDPQAVRFLEAQIREPGFSTTRYYELISAVKEDVSGLSLRDIFRKDFKQWDEAGLSLGISCVVQGFEYLLEKAGTKHVFLAELAAWADERKLDVAAVMTTSHPGGNFHRQLLVWGLTDRGKAAIGRFGDVGRPLGLEQWEDGALDGDDGDGGNTRFAWRQANLAASRKQVAPLLREALREKK
ncbi:exopolyphosphatase [Metarhizium album ARSEF 1941]|uniref:Exopolyphosphatase n=1 Tax=Metarhizium album (strain ARSEF 1941) TaxID=1081103 RepID=A0A0B2WQX2_METAS|nr:exopolyphosphatase [Metarhizium album ARSEF 1941]KHN98461.1 exopolyphosphatase [Metarhizium album ARSEF 1941]